MPQPDIILAGASVRSLAESAIRDGIQPLCIDMFGDQDLRNLHGAGSGVALDVRRIDEYSEIQPRLNDVSDHVPILLAGGAENDSALVNALRVRRPVLSPSTEVLEELRNPASLFPVLARAGIDVPRFVAAGSLSDNPGEARQELRPPADDRPSKDHRWLRKPLLSAGGLGVQLERFDDLNGEMSLSGTYLQEQIDGICMSATFLFPPPGNSANNRVQLIGCCLQLSGDPRQHAPTFAFGGNVGPVSVSPDLRTRLQKIGSASSTTGTFVASSALT